MDQTHLLECITFRIYNSFFKKIHNLECITLFKKRKQKTVAEIKSCLSLFNVSNYFEGKLKLCEEDLYDSLNSMQNDKSWSNDGLTKEFNKTFWNKLKEIFVYSMLETKEKGHLSTSPRQTMINLTEKKTEITYS